VPVSNHAANRVREGAKAKRRRAGSAMVHQTVGSRSGAGGSAVRHASDGLVPLAGRPRARCGETPVPHAASGLRLVLWSVTHTSCVDSTTSSPSRRQRVVLASPSASMANVSFRAVNRRGVGGIGGQRRKLS